VTNQIELRIHDRGPFADGHAFGETGAYERLRGTAHYAVDPKAPAQANVFDIANAPVNGKGLVEFSADFLILKPVDPARGNRRLFHDFGNRGNMRMLQFFNDAPGSNDPKTLEHAGNGFLFRHGYTVVWSAWQGDLVPGNGRVLMELPIAMEDGEPITGPVREQYIVDSPCYWMPLSGRASTRSHPTVSRDTSKARLTRRRYPDSERIAIPPDGWEFAMAEGGEGMDDQGAEIGIHPSDRHIYLKEGFKPGWIYELIYTGKAPLVLGLGHAAVRDLISYLRYGGKDAAGNDNPVGPIEKAYSWGRSQTGRCIRDFIYRGFNGDAEGRRVFDGMLPHVAGAGRMRMHHRFANVISGAGCAYEEPAIYGDRFPFSYAECTDHITGMTDAILKRPETDPLVMHSQTATEYWQRRGSLVHTDTKGDDLPQPDGVRVYLWSSSQHFGNPLVKAPARNAAAENYSNTVHTSPFFRAMLVAMDRWATDGTPPPDSAIPTRNDGTLVPFEQYAETFPKIPGCSLPVGPHRLPLYDFGPDADDGLITRHPPDVADATGYTVLLPAADADGNDIPGIRAPMVQAPLGTYTGWNRRKKGHGHGYLLSYEGSYIPFPDTSDAREAARDPRTSILERYGSAEAYVAAIRKAAEALAAEGYMLAEDVDRAVAMAQDWGRSRHDVGL
jgi:hypothetical protein